MCAFGFEGIVTEDLAEDVEVGHFHEVDVCVAEADLVAMDGIDRGFEMRDGGGFEIGWEFISETGEHVAEGMDGELDGVGVFDFGMTNLPIDGAEVGSGGVHVLKVEGFLDVGLSEGGVLIEGEEHAGAVGELAGFRLRIGAGEFAGEFFEHLEGGDAEGVGGT